MEEECVTESRRALLKIKLKTREKAALNELQWFGGISCHRLAEIPHSKDGKREREREAAIIFSVTKTIRSIKGTFLLHLCFLSFSIVGAKRQFWKKQVI